MAFSCMDLQPLPDCEWLPISLVFKRDFDHLHDQLAERGVILKKDRVEHFILFWGRLRLG